MRQMIRLHDVILLLIQIVGNNNFIRVFLRIDRVLLQTDIYFTETHRSRVCAKRFPECQMITVFHGTDLLTFEICKTVDCFICTHNTESLICHTKQMITAVRINITDQTVKIRLIDFFTAVIQRIKHAWKVKDCQITHERNLWSCILYDKRDITVGTGLQEVTVASERGVCVYLNFHFTIT